MRAPEPESLTEAQILELREALHRKRDDIEQSLAASRDDSRPVAPDQSIGRLTRMDAMQQQQMAVARRRRQQTQLAQIQQALNKIPEGTYGECVRCEEPIGLARLRARPETPFCRTCQATPEQ